MGGTGQRWLFRLVLLLLYSYLLVAPIVVVYYSFSPGVVLKLPPDGFTLQWYANFLAQPRLLDGIWTSTLLAALSAVIAVAVGVPAAFALVRRPVRARRLVSSFLLAPLNLPGLVLAISILMFVARWVQPLVEARVVGGFPALLAAHVLVTTPWVIRTVSASLEIADRTIEEAARGLGASPLATFFLVTVPAIQPGIVAGAIFAFIVSFGNFALSLFFTGPSIITLPVAIYQYVDQFQDPTVAAGSTLVIVLTTLIVIAADRSGTVSRGVGGHNPANSHRGGTP
ncbi:MAG: ABC transporter permease [Chloroflexota bacterium]